MTQVSAAFHNFSLRSHTVRLLASGQPSSLLISAFTRADMHSTGPESPQELHSEASDHGASGEAEQLQEHAAPKEPALEREDWMSKAMPKSIPGAAPETADKAKEEPAKKVTLLSRKAFYVSLAQKSQSLQERVHRAQHRSCLAQRICDLDVTICGVSRVCSPVLMWCFADELCGVQQPQHTAVQIFPFQAWVQSRGKEISSGKAARLQSVTCTMLMLLVCRVSLSVCQETPENYWHAGGGAKSLSQEWGRWLPRRGGDAQGGPLWHYFHGQSWRRGCQLAPKSAQARAGK